MVALLAFLDLGPAQNFPDIIRNFEGDFGQEGVDIQLTAHLRYAGGGTSPLRRQLRNRNFPHQLINLSSTDKPASITHITELDSGSRNFKKEIFPIQRESGLAERVCRL
jgi:hypothetical protein